LIGSGSNVTSIPETGLPLSVTMPPTATIVLSLPPQPTRDNETEATNSTAMHAVVLVLDFILDFAIQWGVHENIAEKSSQQIQKNKPSYE
jgi:hypothetical protein